MNDRARRPRSMRLVRAGALAAALLASSGVAAGKSECDGVTVVVSVDWDHDRAAKVAGVVARVTYPTSVDVPADERSGSAKARVELLTGTSGGLFDAVRRDTDGDRRQDLLSVGLITAGIGPGPFARIRFECRPGASRPVAADFSCVTDVADEGGSVPSTCSVALAGK